MEVIAGVFLVLRTLVSPIDTDFGVENFSAVQSLQSSLRGAHVDIFDKSVVETAVLVVTVRDNFNMLNGASDGEDFSKHVLSHPGAKISNVKMGAPLDWKSDKRKIKGRDKESNTPEPLPGLPFPKDS